MDSHQKDNLIDALLFSAVFYILSSNEVLAIMAKHGPIQNAHVTNTFLFGFSYLLVQRLTNRL
jgi:hypothetical protein